MFACRGCFELFTDASKGCFLNSGDAYDDLSLMAKLLDSVPELVFNGVEEVFLCFLCVSTLQTTYEFRKKCCEIQQSIHEYLEKRAFSNKVNYNMCKIALHYKNMKVDNLPNEVAVIKKEPEEKEVVVEPKSLLKCDACLTEFVLQCDFQEHVLAHALNNLSQPSKKSKKKQAARAKREREWVPPQQGKRKSARLAQIQSPKKKLTNLTKKQKKALNRKIRCDKCFQFYKYHMLELHAKNCYGIPNEYHCQNCDYRSQTHEIFVTHACHPKINCYETVVKLEEKPPVFDPSLVTITVNKL